MTAQLEIDHVFVFTPPGAEQEVGRLTQSGIVINDRLRHVGQGTANACCFFDNAYLELLWAIDDAELASPGVVRTRLAERSRWRETGASPFGIAVRTVDGGELPFETWRYQAPFFPDGGSLPVATASDDPRQPMLFRSPSSMRPDQWRSDRPKDRQVTGGYSEITSVELSYPDTVKPDPVFLQLASGGMLSLGNNSVGPTMTLNISHKDPSRSLKLRLPSCELVA
ncbi:MAG: VOC family protein [Pseudomonadota bacterium]